MTGHYFVYILQCHDDTFYTGWTVDVAQRLQQHQLGKASKYTRARLPVRLVYQEVLSSKREAMQREYAIKQLSRRQKMALVGNKLTSQCSCL